MKKFNIKKILIPLDFSETALLALEHGTQMAALFKADLLLLHVVKPSWSVITVENSSIPTDVLQYQGEIAMEKLDEFAKRIRTEEKISVETLCVTGRVCPVILETAEKHHADVIVMGTHGSSGFEERFIGSNAYRVVNESVCPVVTIQKNSLKKGFKDIVLPIDNSFYTRQKVNHAVELALRYGSRIHILGLSNSEDETDINKMKIKIDQIEDVLGQNRILNDKKILTGINYGKLTINYAEEIGADLIIIMTEWEEDITGLFIGPFARQIVNHSRIPVMSVRPVVRSEMIETGYMSWMEQH